MLRERSLLIPRRQKRKYVWHSGENMSQLPLVEDDWRLRSKVKWALTCTTWQGVSESCSNCSLCIAHCVLHTVYCTLCIAYCVLLTIHCTRNSCCCWWWTWQEANSMTMFQSDYANPPQVNTETAGRSAQSDWNVVKFSSYYTKSNNNNY